MANADVRFFEVHWISDGKSMSQTVSGRSWYQVVGRLEGMGFVTWTVEVSR